VGQDQTARLKRKRRSAYLKRRRLRIKEAIVAAKKGKKVEAGSSS
jgi:hypothetical protein